MIERSRNSSECSSQQEILLPKCNIHPANQIIVKQYEPDQTPLIKFIPRQVYKQNEQRKYSYQLYQPKISNPQIEQYANIFGSQDFLGSYYSDKMDKMVYLKFNNKDYNQLKLADKKYRFFSGFFVEKQHFDQVSFQKHDNIMKSFPFLDFVDYNTNILQSFGKNAKGNLQDPKFSSNYDSANLFAVIKRANLEYDLILQNDMNSKGNNQWFNFLVHFTQEGTYKFNIVNLTKTHSLYEQGMRIACYSFLKQSYRGNNQNKKTGSGWFRTGQNIKYFKNGIQRQTLGSNDSYYTLSFQYTCKNRAESMIFAHSIPYSNLELQKYFNKILYRRLMSHLKMQKVFICNSLAGQPIHCFVITHRKLKSNLVKFRNSATNGEISQNNDKNKTVLNFVKMLQKKNNPNQSGQQTPQLKSVIVMSRQHSGQTQSSFVLQGIVDFLMTNTQLDQIKRNYIFFIFPMINVDGVKYGHYRTNLAGFDLNRIWRVPRKDIHPEVYHTKKLMYQINRNHPISFILDIHGHSKSLNSFFYGNPSKKQNLNFEDPKIFPYICSKRIKQVSYKQSTFNIRQQKKSSARVVLSQMFPKALVYTLQNSFHGFCKKSKQDTQQTDEQIVEFTPEGYRRVGRQIMSTYLEYTRLCQKNTTIKAKWVKQMESIYAEMQKSRCVQTADDGGSDSQLQNQLIDFQQKIQQKRTNDTQKSQTMFIQPRKIQKTLTNFYQKRNNIFRRTQKKKTMPLPKTICDENVRGISAQNYRGINTLNDLSLKNQDKQNFYSSKGFNKADLSSVLRKPQYPQAVLSIFKIQTQNSALLKKKSSIKNLVNAGYLDTNNLKTQNSAIQNTNKSYFMNSHSSTSLLKSTNNRNMIDSSCNNTKEQQKIIIHNQRKVFRQDDKKNVNIEEVMNKCAGMKTFLKAMGITIENRKG